jgi:hypothetical protein
MKARKVTTKVSRRRVAPSPRFSMPPRKEEGHPQFAARFAPLFARHEEGALQLAVTTVTLSEVLAGPLGEGEEAIARRYRVNDSATPGSVSRADFTRDTHTLEHYNKEKLGVFRRV